MTSLLTVIFSGTGCFMSICRRFGCKRSPTISLSHLSAQILGIIYKFIKFGKMIFFIIGFLEIKVLLVLHMP